MYASNYEEGFGERGLVPFGRYTFFQSLVERFQEGRSWEDTEWYWWLMDNIEQDIIRYEHPAAVRRRLSEVDRLFEDMKYNGYCDARHNDVTEYISVDIGRDGRIFLDEGRHRAAIAKILGIKRVPVRVFVRHWRWQKKESEAGTDSNCSSRH